MNGNITRSQFIDLLSSLVKDRRTSTVYVRTDDNHLIIASVDSGEIVSLICGPKRGERAVPMIRKMHSGSFRLEEGASAHRGLGGQLPPSDTLLSLLMVEEEGDAKVSDCQWVQSVLCKMLKEYMGPIAPLVCQETIDSAGGLDSPDKCRQVVEKLAHEIDDMAEAESFRSRAHAELAAVLS